MIVLFCFVLYLRDRPNSDTPHVGHLTGPRARTAGHTPHTLCGAVKRPRVRLQPIRIQEAFAGRDVRSTPSESLTCSVMLDTPVLPGPRRAGTQVPSRMVQVRQGELRQGGLGHRPYPPAGGQDAIEVGVRVKFPGTRHWVGSPPRRLKRPPKRDRRWPFGRSQPAHGSALTLRGKEEIYVATRRHTRP